MDEEKLRPPIRPDYLRNIAPFTTVARELRGAADLIAELQAKVEELQNENARLKARILQSKECSEAEGDSVDVHLR